MIMAELENFDLAHISAVEILTPTFDESLRFFNEMLGMREVERIGNSAYLRCWDEYETYSIKLTASETNGVGRTMLRATSPEALERRVAAIEATGLGKGWRDPRSEEHTSELQSRFDLVCRLLLEKKKTTGQ